MGNSPDGEPSSQSVILLGNIIVYIISMSVMQGLGCGWSRFTAFIANGARRLVIGPKSTPLGKGVQAGKAAAQSIYLSLSLGVRTDGPVGWHRSGVRQNCGREAAAVVCRRGARQAQKIDRQRSKSRERHAPIEQALRGAIRGSEHKVNPPPQSKDFEK